jgi:hypothetical protein
VEVQFQDLAIILHLHSTLRQDSTLTIPAFKREHHSKVSMNRSIIASFKIAIYSIVICAFASTSFAAVDMFLEIKDVKGKVVSRCPVNSDGSFQCPALPAGDYTASLEWSWGASNSSSSSSGGGMGAGKVVVHDISVTRSPSAISLNFIVSPRDLASGQASGKRDAASGQATGKRQHKPFTFVKQIDKSSPTISKVMDKSSPKLMLTTFTVDEDCDGITGKVSATNEHKDQIEIESWSWGATNSGSSR